MLRLFARLLQEAAVERGERLLLQEAVVLLQINGNSVFSLDNGARLR
jgi:hypothetical protein